MYFFDSERGRRRRMRVRNQTVHAARKARDLASAGGADLKQRIQGTAYALAARLHEDEPSDPVLAGRVRSKIGRYVGHPASIEVVAEEGDVVVSGHVLRDEHPALIEAIRSVPGVRMLTDRLIVHTTAEGVSELQGGRPRRGERADFMQDTWAPGTRLAGMTSGATLALAALAGRGLGGLLVGGAGALLFVRSLTNKPLRQWVGSSGRRGIELQKTLTIDAPVQTVFAYLSDFQNFPRFMHNVRSVEPRAQGQTHWTVAGPAGSDLHWDCVITQYTPNEVIAWRTLEGSAIAHAGAMRFEFLDGATRLHVRMHYTPPAGALGHALARMFGADAQSKLDEDLHRLKAAIETDRAPHGAAAAPRIHPEPMTG
jgi:uncharacterized membrane protein